jgi:hypothetical protein
MRRASIKIALGIIACDCLFRLALGDNFLWAADIQEDVAEPLYVDSLHYSGRMSELFAQTIVNAMSERALPAKGR